MSDVLQQTTATTTDKPRSYNEIYLSNSLDKRMHYFVEGVINTCMFMVSFIDDG